MIDIALLIVIPALVGYGYFWILGLRLRRTWPFLRLGPLNSFLHGFMLMVAADDKGDLRLLNRAALSGFRRLGLAPNFEYSGLTEDKEADVCASVELQRRIMLFALPVYALGEVIRFLAKL